MQQNSREARLILAHFNSLAGFAVTDESSRALSANHSINGVMTFNA
jgi:hypothetical protein